MNARTQEVPGYYIWEVPGKPVEVHLHLDVIDGLLPEIMRGFGAVPKRGAEVGGILIGTIDQGQPTVVRIEDFEVVECAYTRGPSYVFSEEDSEKFLDALRRWQAAPSRPTYAVGFFRSHTRDGLVLSPEDIELLDGCFREPAHVALLVKPFATKASIAGFFLRENGQFQPATPLEFPFRRRELTGEESPPRRPLTEGSRRGREAAAPRPTHFPERISIAEPPEAPAATHTNRWMLVPFAVVFLLLGLALGFQAGTSIGRANASSSAQQFALSLSVSKAGNNLAVKWNPEAPSIRLAQRGVLEIDDGGVSKSVDLDPQYLQTGTLTYNNSSNNVHFRLVVYLNGRTTVSETLDWRQ